MNKKKFFIVYKITNVSNNHFYIGIHKTNDANDKYMGSGSNIKKAIQENGLASFKKDILYTFDTKEEALLKEQELVNEVFIRRKDTYNIVLGGGKYTAGFINVKDCDGNCFLVKQDDERYLSGELVGITKGLVATKDINGNTHHVSVDDERYLSGVLKNCNLNTILVKDSNNKAFRVSVNDEKYLSGELVPFSTGKVNVKNANGDFYQIDRNDERYLKGELTGVNKGKDFNTDLKNKILELRKQGSSYNGIVEKTGCSKSTISRYCKKANLSDIGIKPNAISNEKIKKIKKYASTHTIKETAIHFKIGTTTVSKYKN